jgi:hypothetical protein
MNGDSVDDIDNGEVSANTVVEPDAIAEGLLFVSPGWAHDVGNSLQAAGLNLEILKLQWGQANADERTRSALHSVQLQLDRIRQLVSIWVQLSVPDAAEAAPFDWHGLLDDLAVLLSVTLRHRACSVEVRCPDTELLVQGDRFAYLHACLALASAALEYLPEGGQLLFRVEPVTPCLLRCWIGQDTGAATVPQGEGLAPVELLPSAQVAVRGHRARALSFARRTIEREGGKLWYVGSTVRPNAFCFDLPVIGGGSPPKSQSSA